MGPRRPCPAGLRWTGCSAASQLTLDLPRGFIRAGCAALIEYRCRGPRGSPPSRAASAPFPLPCCSKVTARPVRHSIPSLHTGEDGLFESYNIVFANHELWKAARNAWSPFFSQARRAGRGRGLRAVEAPLACLPHRHG